MGDPGKDEGDEAQHQRADQDGKDDVAPVRVQEDTQQGHSARRGMQTTEPLADADCQADGKPHDQGSHTQPGDSQHADHRADQIAEQDISWLGQGAAGIAEQQDRGRSQGGCYQQVATQCREDSQQGDGYQASQPGEEGVPGRELRLVGPTPLAFSRY